MVHQMAEKHHPSIIPICSLCVSDTVGLPFDLLPKQIGHTEVVYVPLPAYSVHTHARAKDIVVDSLVWRLAAPAQGAYRGQSDRRDLPLRSDQDRRSACAASART